MLHSREYTPEDGMADQREPGGAAGAGKRLRQHQIHDGDHDGGAQQHGREQHDHDQHLRRLLLHERRDPPLQLGKLDRLYEHAVARHFRQTPAGQVRDVP